MAETMTETPVAFDDAGMSQKYIDDLYSDLQDAQRSRDEYGQASQKAKAEYNISSKYCDDLSDYLSRIEKTYNMVIDMEDFINAFIAHTDNVCTNVDHTGKAIKMIIECYKCVVEQTEGLKQMVKDLLDAIEKLTDPVLNSEESLMKCLNDLYKQIDETLKSQKTAMDSLILVWRSVTDLEYTICNNADTTQSPVSPDLGLAYELAQLHDVLCCQYCGGSSDNIAVCEDDTIQDSDQLNKCCGDKPDTPQSAEIDCSVNKPALCNTEGKEGFNSDFYCNLETNKTYICELTEYLRCVWKHYEKQQGIASARYEAIQKAHEAATKAKALCN